MIKLIMGKNIQESQFNGEDFDRFYQKMVIETEDLRERFTRREFCDEPGYTMGLELETWIADDRFSPAPVNKELLGKVDDPFVVPELSKFNAEINTPPSSLGPGCLERTEAHLKETWTKLQQKAKSIQSRMLMIGTLPTLTDRMLGTEYMSEFERYKALNEQILLLRQGEPLQLEISGRDYLKSVHQDIMLEAAATSLQLHLQPPFSQALDFYNASIVASAPLVALCANSPFLFGKELWDESRIPIFEQSVHLPGIRTLQGQEQQRVTFGSDFATRSLLEVFEENLDCYPVLLPIVADSSPGDWFHIRLHNGNIWRWNRPVLDSQGPKPRLRIEQRVPPAGPTLRDIVANLAFFVGLSKSLADEVPLLWKTMSFESTKKDFYSAARFGMEIPVQWGRKSQVNLRRLILEELIPLSKKGLMAMGIGAKEAEHYMEDVLHGRAKTGQTGSQWQRSFVDHYGRDFQRMTERYFENQESGKPVHLWPV